MLSAISLLAAACGVASVAAHATFQELWINGVDHGGYCVRLPLSNSPVTSVTSDDIICNVTPTAAYGTCSVNPGDQITAEMHQQPGQRTCANEAIGGDHWGPIQAYMAPISSPGGAATGLSWFKIAETGLVSNGPSTDYWATEVLNDNCGHYTFNIPTGIAPGSYLLRVEVLALHVASSVGGAQFYMSCYQINVGGSGSITPSGVAFPGAYSATDPGILIDIYESPKAYTIPGPTPYGTASPIPATTAWPTTATWNTALQPTADFTTAVGGSAAVPTTTASSKPSSPTTTTTSSSSYKAPTTTTTVAPTSTTSTASGATQTKYGQCGGTGWTGPTVCASGSTCKAISPPYYSQCQ